jgi:hypothetical protein
LWFIAARKRNQALLHEAPPLLSRTTLLKTKREKLSASNFRFRGVSGKCYIRLFQRKIVFKGGL